MRHFLKAIALLFSVGASAESWVEYEGSYVCSQGKTQLSLSINEEKTKALFKFTTRRGISGKFNMVGEFDAATNKMTLRARDWIEQPSGYGAIDLVGEFDKNMEHFSGVIPKFSGCTTFSVKAKYTRLKNEIASVEVVHETDESKIAAADDQSSVSSLSTIIENIGVLEVKNKDYMHMHALLSLDKYSSYYFQSGRVVPKEGKRHNHESIFDTRIRDSIVPEATKTGNAIKDEITVTENNENYAKVKKTVLAKTSEKLNSASQKHTSATLSLHYYLDKYDASSKKAYLIPCEKNEKSYRCYRQGTSFSTLISSNMFDQIIHESAVSNGISPSPDKAINSKIYAHVSLEPTYFDLDLNKALVVSEKSVVNDSVRIHFEGYFDTYKNPVIVNLEMDLQPVSKTSKKDDFYEFSRERVEDDSAFGGFYLVPSLTLLPVNVCLKSVNGGDALVCNKM